MTTVSVIIPTYNRKDYVQEAIDSVLAQTYTDYEIIVVDDGSTDGTGKALRARYGDCIRYVWQKNQGESVARNRGIEMAQGEYIAFLDSDDLWLPEKLERQMEALAANPDFAMVFSQAWQIDARGDIVPGRKFNQGVTTQSLVLEKMCFNNMVTAPSTVVAARSVIRAAGGFDPAIRYGEDYDLFLRLRLLTPMMIISEPLACVRIHQGTQCYYPSAEKNAQRREASLSTLRKLFDAWDEAPREMQGRAVAWQYFQSSLLEAAIGNGPAVKACLEQVALHDPSLLGDHDRFDVAVADQAARVYENGGRTALPLCLDLVKTVLKELGGVVPLSRSFARKVMARSCVSVGFAAYRKRDLGTTRLCFSRAIVLDRSFIVNRGILSLLFEAFLGKKVSDLRRTLFNNLRQCFKRS